MSDLWWNLAPPASSPMGDHEVPLDGRHLAGRRVALLVCGGIAAMKAPLVARALRRQGAEVVAFASEEALRYVGRAALEWATVGPVVTELTWRAEHLSDDTPFDAYLVAPATYNTLNKVATGIADGVVTATLASALGRLEQGRTAVLAAPTMHASLHNAVLVQSCRRLRALGVGLVTPRDAYGKHNLPDEPVLVAAVCRAVSRSLLAGRRILVTGGPTPVPIDQVRRIANKFTGQLGGAIAAELYLRGADTLLIHGEGTWRPPAWVPHRVAATYDDYKREVMNALGAVAWDAAVFSAAVADYRPREAHGGKIASGAARLTLDLVPTEKVIDLVQAAHPDLPLVTFKYVGSPGTELEFAL